MQPNGSIGYPRAASSTDYPEHPVHGTRHRDPTATVSPGASVDFRSVESDGASEIVPDGAQNLVDWNIVRGLFMWNLGTKRAGGIVHLEPGKTKECQC